MKQKNQQIVQPGVTAAAGGATVQPVQPVTSVQSTAQPQAQTQSSQPRTQTVTMGGRSGVSQGTQQQLNQYAQGYQPSAAVQQAQQYLNQMQQNRPGEYQSPYQGQLDALYEQISGRGPFTYDLNADMLYRQYRDQYQRLGQQAMMDTMGQAAGLTGGYGSTYSQNAGQQAYESYLQQLNDRIPELYDRALSKWEKEGDALYRQYGLLNDREQDAYGRYRDTVSDWRQDYQDAYNRYTDERGFDYGQWGDMLNWWTNQADRENSEWWQQTQFDYQKQRDAVADSQWERQFAAQQAARAAAQRAASQDYDALMKQYQDLLAKLKGIPNYSVVPGVRQNTYEIPGYGTANQQQYDELLAAGVIDKNGRLKRWPITGNWNLIK